ncbi:hypothetical protein FDECE_3190 [Fusarium decemcellulare]|nr:hypothetical protein FDECE_3190 [Fusarium decemcellulare]
MRTLPLLTTLAAGASAGIVSAPVVKRRFNLGTEMQKRDTLDLDALNNVTGGGYYAEFDVGTPGQKVSFLLDTGSSDTWVNSDDTDLCNSDELQESYGFCMTTFNPDDSDTYKVVDRNGFDITYLDTRRIRGDYFEDSINIDGKTIKKQQLGLASKSVRPTGIMGLGFSANVAADKPYDTIIDNMVAQGLIDTAAFSLWLNDLGSDEGTILFGGLDKAKYVGKLATLPLLPEPGALGSNITSFSVAIEGLEVNTPDGQDDVNLDGLESDAIAILDSGSTICLLPDDQVKDIFDAFDVLSVQNVAVPFVDCAYGDDKGDGISFDFKFKGKTISVPMKEMVINAFEGKQETFQDPRVSPLFKGWDSVCMFGISSAADYGVKTDSFALLGDTFLRSAYVVYDLANEQLGIAEANPGTNDSDIVELKADDKDFPDVSGVRSKSPTATDGSSSSGTRPTVTVTAGSDASAGTSSDDGDDNAAGHLAPAFMATLMLALGAVVAVV